MRNGLRSGWTACALAILASSGCGKEPAKDTARDTLVEARPAPVAPPADRRQAVLMLGTSLTAGLGLDPDSTFPAILQRKVDSAGIPLRIVNAGFSGETSAGALRRIDWLLRDSARVVLIETGANDGLRGQDIDSMEANLRGIVRRVKTVLPGAVIVLAQMESPPSMGVRFTTAFRAVFPTVAREEGVELLPFLLDGVAGVPEFNQSDGIHPNETGARMVADNVFRFLEPLLRRIQ